MITKAIIDYEQHCTDLYEKLKKYGDERARDFIKFYRSRWDKFGKPLLDYHICWRLYDNYRVVKHTGVKWYAIVGAGGTGKSWLSWKIAYFLDDKFTLNNSCFTLQDFVEKMKNLSESDTMRSLTLDEPDVNMIGSSKEGRLFANIIGQARQLKLFLIYNATDLAYIPQYIFRKITGLFWCSNLGEVYFYEDRPENYKYTLSEIKWDYYKKKWYCFVERIRTPGCLPFRNSKQIPFTNDEVKEYLNRKTKRINDSYDLFLQLKNTKNNAQMTREWYDNGISQSIIAKRLGVSTRTISNYLRKTPISKKQEA